MSSEHEGVRPFILTLGEGVSEGVRPFILTLDFGLAYLGRYTHRVAISNARSLEVNDRTVRFVYRDRKDASKKKEMELPGPKFLRRFFPHTLPAGFTRIRHSGFLGNGVRRQRLPVIRTLIGTGRSLRLRGKGPFRN